MRALPTLLLLALPVLGWGQAADSLSRADSLKGGVPDVVPEAFRTDPARFKEGKGVAMDTLDIADGRLLLVLRDDHTWYYIKNIKMLGEEDVFKDNWVANTTDAYHIPLDSLPLHNTILLVDETSSFVCPNQTKPFSKFGYRHGRRHQGVDLPLKTGTPVVAAFDGRVRMSEYHSGYGNLIIIRHENGLETFYAHLSKREVEVGDWVRAGDQIGLGGSTCRSTGPHLHFETRYKGFAFDPEWIADYEKGDTMSRSRWTKKRTCMRPMRRSWRRRSASPPKKPRSAIIRSSRATRWAPSRNATASRSRPSRNSTPESIRTGSGSDKKSASTDADFSFAFRRCRYFPCLLT